MMHDGDLIVCGNASQRLGHGMYGGRIYVAGAVGQLGEGVAESALTEDERARVDGIVATAGLAPGAAVPQVHGQLRSRWHG